MHRNHPVTTCSHIPPQLFTSSCYCFTAKGVGSPIFVPKTTALNKEWYQHTVWQQLLPTIQEQLGDKMPFPAWWKNLPLELITKWTRPQAQWELLVNPQEAGGKTKNTNSDKLQTLIIQEWAAISEDMLQKLTDSMPGRRRVNNANLDYLYKPNVTVNKSVCHLWYECNYTWEWQKDLKTLKQLTKLIKHMQLYFGFISNEL